ncbi:MAG TPA: hypothetical protein VFR18_05645 [Terriglobia bacterium]|nr:hypothetical protein [Terriglobia bacterium]
MEKKWYHYFVVAEAAKDAEKEAPPTARTAAPSPTPRRAAEMVPDIDSETTFTTPLGDASSFDDIYASAQIVAPPHGYSVLKVADMLESEHIQALPADVKRKSILVALDAASVNINDIVEDAVRRDRALDTYERVLVKNLENLRAEKERENKRLEDEINQKMAELRARIADNTKAITEEQESLLQWRTRKTQEEERIAQAVGYFVSENPITTAGGNSTPSGSPDQK